VQVASTSADFQPDERDPEVELVLTESDYTLKMWPHKFKAVSCKTKQTGTSEGQL
jgi:glucose-6-phosphate 1-epimerase